MSLPGKSTATSPRRRRPFYRDLSFQVIAGMALGVATGYVFPKFGINLQPLGDAFIRVIQMLIGPIIFCTVCSGIAGVKDFGKVGRVAIKSLFYASLEFRVGGFFRVKGGRSPAQRTLDAEKSTSTLEGSGQAKPCAAWPPSQSGGEDFPALGRG